ncbi:MAG: hypothetical protein AAFS07_17545 [Pseudomonadota bacterium]
MGQGIGNPSMFNQTFLQTVNEVQSKGVSDVNDTVRHTDKKGLYRQNMFKSIWAGIKDTLHLHSKSNKDHMADRAAKEQAGATKLFNDMSKSYGEGFAKKAFEAVGSGHTEVAGYDMVGDAKIQKKAFVPTKVTNGQLNLLKHMAERFESTANRQFQKEQVLCQMAGSKLLEIELTADGKNDEEFKLQAKRFCANFIEDSGAYTINVSYVDRKKVSRLTGNDQSHIDNMSTDQLKDLRQKILVCTRANEGLMSSNVVAKFELEKYALQPNLSVISENLNLKEIPAINKLSDGDLQACGLDRKTPIPTIDVTVQLDSSVNLEPPSRPAPTPEEYGATTLPTYQQATNNDDLPLHTNENADPAYLDANTATTSKPTSTTSVNISDEIEDDSIDLPPKIQNATLTAEELEQMNSKA